MRANINENSPGIGNAGASIIEALKKSLGLLQVLTIGLFVGLLLISVFIPDVTSQAVPNNSLFQGIIAALLVVFVMEVARGSKDSCQKTTDIFLILGIVLLAWEVLIGKFALLDPFLFPAPGKVFAVFAEDYVVMYRGMISSFAILLSGYLLAVAVAVPLALVIGWRKRAFSVAYPIAKAVSPIPPTVYLPYAIVLLPTFSSASVFVIFIGAFWPIFVGTVHGVFSIDQRIINSAKTLGLKEYVMLRKVVLPAALPSIFSGATIALIMSFITLTVAEMIAATSGLGWYIEYQHQYANYDKVIAGMILMGASVVAVMWIFDKIQKYCLRWQNAEGAES
ncbi:MAG: ABC transporter permease [Methanothrix soehngenii]|jgi:NitT/TauT family transport system permease protein|nr:ABC transporter permease [Methanothrix soehngenii]